MSPVIFWIVAVAIPIPLVSIYLLRLWNIEQYSFFPVLFAAVAAMAYTRWDKKWYFPSQRLSLLCIVTAVIFELAAAALWSPWLAYFGFVLTITSLFSSVREKQEKEGHEPWTNGSLLYLALPLWLCLRLPFALDQTLTLRLQHFTASVSSYVLDLLSVPHRISGIIFDLPGGKLFVEEACSGVQSLFALMCVALLLSAYNRRPVVLIPVYCLAAIFCAGLLNIVRVTAIALAQEQYQYDLAKGIPHEILGYSCLALAIILLASFDRLFRVVFFPLSDADNPLLQEQTPNPLKLWWNTTLSLKAFQSIAQVSFQRLPTIFSGLLLFAFISAWLAQSFFAAQSLNGGNLVAAAPSAIWLPPASALASDAAVQIENYERQVGQNDISEGEYVDIWNVLDKQALMRHRVAISQPYLEFHDLCACYRGVGWQLQDRENVYGGTDAASPEQWPFVFAKFVNANGNYAYLSFSGIDQAATSVPPPGESLTDLFTQRVWHGLKNTSSQKVLMFQIWTTSDEPLSKNQIEELKSLHVKLRSQAVSTFQKSLSNN